MDEVAAQVLPADKAGPFSASRRAAGPWRWSATASTTLRRWWRPISASRSAPARTWRIKSADIVLVRNDPRDVVGAIELSRASYRKMTENLVWATGYNVVAIPVAAGILVPWGIDLSMAAGAVAMSASTIIVALNAQSLRRLRLCA